MIKEYARAYGLGYTILRYFNASGADPDGQYGESRHVEGHIIPLTLMVAVGRREKLKIFGGDWETRDGTCVRDYVHTDDLAQAHQLAVEALGPGVAGEYNLGSGTGDDDPGSAPGLREGRRPADPPRGRRPSPRRPRDPDRHAREGHQGTRLVAPVSRHRRDRRDRLALAQHPPRRLRHSTALS